MDKMNLKTGFTEGMWELIQERADQINKKGYDGENQADHPEYYADNQLIYASSVLATPTVSVAREIPKNWDFNWWHRLCTKPHEERLAIAGAFLACEIDRLKVLQKRLEDGQK